jgi:hypothetical protein
MSVQVGYSAKTSERNERENAAEKQGQERHLGRTANSNTTIKTKKGGIAMFEDYCQKKTTGYCRWTHGSYTFT